MTPAPPGDEAVKVADGRELGLHTRTINGLYALRACGVRVRSVADPRMVCLRQLARSVPCSGHVDGLAAYGWEPGEMWGAGGHGSGIVLTSVGLLASTFFLQDVADGAFFASGSNMMRRLTSHDEWDQMLQHDAVALFVGSSAGSVRDVLGLLARPFPGHQAWLEQMCNLHRAVVMPAEDGTRMCVYARTKEGLDTISGPLEAARIALETHPWFTANRHRLVWEDVWNGCLVLPDHPDLAG